MHFLRYAGPDKKARPKTWNQVDEPAGYGHRGRTTAKTEPHQTLQSLKQYGVIDGVKCCGHVQQHQQRDSIVAGRPKGRCRTVPSAVPFRLSAEL